MRRFVDLHIHTCFSDGTATPQEVLDMARSSNVAAIAITDHDTVEGYLAVRQIITEDDPELIAGVEFSVTMENADMHILAYLFDPECTPLKASLHKFQQHRSERGRKMVDKLVKLGVDITYADVQKVAGDAVIGRPHVGRAMFEKGALRYYEEAFDKYIGYDGPAYVPKSNFTSQQAIDLIHEANGLAVLAHPAIDEKDRYLPMLLEMGLDGIEVYHPSHSRSDIDRFKHLADRHRLLMTGGSDFHGMSGRYDRVGSLKVPYECLESLKAKKK
ncbi:MAG: PHP domain-containing protein [candidate division Zixibacteria bacterium]